MSAARSASAFGARLPGCSSAQIGVRCIAAPLRPHYLSVGVQVVRALLERYGDLLDAVRRRAHHAHVDLVADLMRLNRLAHVTLIADLLRIHVQDDVPGIDACEEGRTLWNDAIDQDTAVGGQAERGAERLRNRLEADAEPRPANDLHRGLAGRDQIADDAARGIDRYREAEANAAAARPRAQDRGVDADQLPVDVCERSAGVPSVDRRVGLDGAVELVALLDLEIAAVERGDHAHGHCRAEAERVSDRYRPFADLHAVRVAELCGRQVGGADADHREVCLRVDTDEARVVPLAVRKRNPDAVGAIHDMVVGHDVAVRRDDYAGAFAVDLLVDVDGSDGLLAGLDLADGVDVYDGGLDALYGVYDRVRADGCAGRPTVQYLQRAALRLMSADRLAAGPADQHAADQGPKGEDTKKRSDATRGHGIAPCLIRLREGIPDESDWLNGCRRGQPARPRPQQRRVDSVALALDLAEQAGHLDRHGGCLGALVACFGAGSLDRLLDALYRDDAKGDRQAAGERGAADAGSDGGGDMIVVRGRAADDAAERDKRVVAARIRHSLQGKWDLEAAGHPGDRDLLLGGAVALQRVQRAVEQRPGDEVVPAADDDAEREPLGGQIAFENGSFEQGSGSLRKFQILSHIRGTYVPVRYAGTGFLHRGESRNRRIGEGWLVAGAWLPPDAAPAGGQPGVARGRFGRADAVNGAAVRRCRTRRPAAGRRTGAVRADRCRERRRSGALRAERPSGARQCGRDVRSNCGRP